MSNLNEPGLSYSESDSINGALNLSTVANIFWMHPTAAQWVKACITAGHSRGVAGCPSLEVAEYVYAAMGA